MKPGQEWLGEKEFSIARRTRRTHAPGFKAQVAVAALRKDKILAELAKHLELHPTQIVEWKRQLLEHAAGGPGPVARQDRPAGPGE